MYTRFVGRRSSGPRISIVALCGVFALQVFGAEQPAASPPGPGAKPFAFARDVQPILERSCVPCHSGERAKAKFRLDSREAMLRGGESKEEAVVPGNSAASQVVRFAADLVEEMEMPPLEKRDRYPKMSDSEIAMVRAWIDQGAHWPEGVVLTARPETTPQKSPGAPATLSPESEHPVFAMIRRGDEQGVAAWLKEAPDLNLRDESGNTPLLQAAFYLEAAQLAPFLDRGADVNAANTAGMTALMKAVSDVEKIRLLLKRSAKVNGASSAGNTALIIAGFEFGAAPVVRELIKAGADVHAANKRGINAVTAAAEAGDVDVLRLLLDHGADPNSKSAIRESGAEITALMTAAQLGHIEFVRTLLARGADVNLQTVHGNAVHFAAFSHRQEVLRLLLDHRAEVNVRGQRLLSFRKDTGLTALIYAAHQERNDPTMVQWLIERGADVNARASSGETALDVARQRGRTRIVSALEAAGARDEAAEAAPEILAARWTPDRLERADAGLFRQAAEAAATVLIKSGARLTEATANRCSTCHQQSLPALVGAMALAKGLDYPGPVAREQLQAAMQVSRRGGDFSLEQPTPVPNIQSWLLIGLGAGRVPPGTMTDNIAYSLARHQYGDGRWISKASRAPTDAGDVTSTALAIRALQLYASPTMKTRMDARVAAGARWLGGFAADSLEERAMQILGLHWAGWPNSQIETFARALRAEQRADGGWAQLATLDSDAYATGLALYALHQAGGIVTTEPAYRRGAAYLLKHQLADGTWKVKTRVSPVQVAIDDIFPHGTHQWISSVATGWSSLALMLTLPDRSRQISGTGAAPRTASD